MTNKEIEKIVRAKIKIEESMPRHGDRCMIELDLDYYGPCTCGRQAAIDAAQTALSALNSLLDK